MNESKYAASASDGKELLRILESSAAKGNIELIYTRRPDAYESYMKESGEARVFISRDGERAVGTCAEIVREVYIGGEAKKAAYICGLKKDADYEGGVGFGARFIRELQRDDVDFYYCSVVAENTDARKMFEKSRRLLEMNHISGYKTYIMSPRVRIKAPKRELIFRQANESDRRKLIGFLNTEGKKRDMFPVIKTLDEFYNLSAEDFYLLLDGERIVAAAALWKQTEYKQYVVKKYRGIMRLARVANPILSALRYIRLPKENAPLDFPMLSFFLCENDSEEYFRIFLSEIKREIAKAYGMFVIGLNEGHFAFPILEKLPSVSFETNLYEIRFPWSGQKYKSPDPQRSFFECGLL
ncbi:MAG: hypothetical protein E7634_04605 [Ruminococcaceae bacterium]|nr:hypothetical protein [Oscillospiraceae bacterium]